MSAAIVIDNGSGFVKAGFAAEKTVKSAVPTVVGKIRNQAMMAAMGKRDAFVGEEALAKRGLLTLKYPIGAGIVDNWDDMEKIWDYIFQCELKVAPEEHPILLSQPALNHSNQREKMAQVMFETYKCPALYLANEALLSLYAAGKTSGVVLDSGDATTNTVPISEGQIVSKAITRLDLGGNELRAYMSKLLTQRCYDATTKAEEGIINDIKENVCFVSLDFEADMASASNSSALDKSYELPDGRVITVGNERFRCPEVLFQPPIIGKEAPGVQECIYNSIMRCEQDIRDVLFANIVLSGGSTMFPGFADRIRKEVTALAPGASEINLNASPERQFFVWLGGAVLASMSTLQEKWITRQEYDESGPSVVHKKC